MTWNNYTLTNVYFSKQRKHIAPKWISIKINLQQKWPSTPQNRPPTPKDKKLGIEIHYGQFWGSMYLGEVIMDLLKKKSSDWQTKNWRWSLRPPESISRELLSHGWRTKILDRFENLIFYVNYFKLWLIQNMIIFLYFNSFSWNLSWIMSWQGH